MLLHVALHKNKQRLLVGQVEVDPISDPHSRRKRNEAFHPSFIPQQLEMWSAAKYGMLEIYTFIEPQ